MGKRGPKPGEVKEIIGFKAPPRVKAELTRRAFQLGVSDSMLLRMLTENFLNDCRKVIDVQDNAGDVGVSITS